MSRGASAVKWFDDGTRKTPRKTIVSVVVNQRDCQCRSEGAADERICEKHREVATRGFINTQERRTAI